MAIFKKRYPSKQEVSEASAKLARETTMRQGRERAVAQIVVEKEKNRTQKFGFYVVTRTGIEPVLPP